MERNPQRTLPRYLLPHSHHQLTANAPPIDGKPSSLPPEKSTKVSAIPPQKLHKIHISLRPTFAIDVNDHQTPSPAQKLFEATPIHFSYHPSATLHTPLHHQPRAQIRINTLMRRVINRPPLVGRILKLVPQKQPRQNHLDLISRKKSSRASIFAMAEV